MKLPQITLMWAPVTKRQTLMVVSWKMFEMIKFFSRTSLSDTLSRCCAPVTCRSQIKRHPCTLRYINNFIPNKIPPGVPVRLVHIIRHQNQ